MASRLLRTILRFYKESVIYISFWQKFDSLENGPILAYSTWLSKVYTYNKWRRTLVMDTSARWSLNHLLVQIFQQILLHVLKKNINQLWLDVSYHTFNINFTKGSVVVACRATGCPFLSTMNLVKFHFMPLWKYIKKTCKAEYDECVSLHFFQLNSYSVSVPPCFFFKYFHKGWAPSPLTSILANMSNFTL